MLFNGADVVQAKIMQRYAELTSVFDYTNFTPEMAQKRIAELASLNTSGVANEEDKATLVSLADTLTGFKPSQGGTKLLELGIFKDTTQKAAEDGSYDAVYQILVSIETEVEGQVKGKSSIIGMVWMKGDKIQSTTSIADLGKVVDAQEFFESLSEK